MQKMSYSRLDGIATHVAFVLACSLQRNEEKTKGPTVLVLSYIFYCT